MTRCDAGLRLSVRNVCFHKVERTRVGDPITEDTDDAERGLVHLIGMSVYKFCLGEVA